MLYAVLNTLQVLPQVILTVALKGGFCHIPVSLIFFSSLEFFPPKLGFYFLIFLIEVELIYL